MNIPIRNNNRFLPVYFCQLVWPSNINPVTDPIIKASAGRCKSFNSLFKSLAFIFLPYAIAVRIKHSSSSAEALRIFFTLKMTHTKENQAFIRDVVAKDYKLGFLEDCIKIWVKDSLSEFLIDFHKQELAKSPLMTIPCMAKKFKVTKATIHNWMNSGLIHGSKVGKNRYFTEDEVKATLIRYGYLKEEARF